MWRSERQFDRSHHRIVGEAIDRCAVDANICDADRQGRGHVGAGADRVVPAAIAADTGQQVGRQRPIGVAEVGVEADRGARQAGTQIGEDIQVVIAAQCILTGRIVYPDLGRSRPDRG